MIKCRRHADSAIGEDGITGLETAILLIAFVVVAAVFSFTVLSAGVFASGKSNEVIQNGLQAAQQTLNSKGALVAFRDSIDTTGDRVGDTGGIVTITFILGSAIPGESIDLTPAYEQHHTQNKLQQNDNGNAVVISYCTDEVFIEDCAWTMKFIGGNDGDNLLEKDESALITVWLVDYDYHPSVGNYYELGRNDDDPFLDNTSELLQAHDTFELQIRPGTGSTLTLRRSLPLSIDSVIDLD